MNVARFGLGALLALPSVLAGCDSLPVTEPPAASSPLPSPEPEPQPEKTPGSVDCDAGDGPFVERAMLALNGRRPWGRGEVRAYESALSALHRGEPPLERAEARRIVARTIMEEDAFRVRWSDFFKDTLRVARTQTKSQASCYGDSSTPYDGGSVLAAYVRDHSATAQAPPDGPFSMRELLASSLVLDDLSVLYRAQLFATLGRPLTGNSQPLELELARRDDFGVAFETAYTNRDVTCLACHNSEFSVSASADPGTNRFWPVRGGFERALFGASSGLHPAAEAAESGTDVQRARGMFRTLQVLDAAGTAPFGWDSALCGAFSRPQEDDPLGVDTYFGSIRSSAEDPRRGRRASVWDLEAALERGVDALAGPGLELAGDQLSDDPDRAFAYLVAMNIVDKVWTELVGQPLTIAHDFPRTQAQRDALRALTDAFVVRRFSLKGLLLDIVTEPIFNLKPPSSGCGGAAYPLARLVDPWTDAEADAAARGNGPSDLVHALPARVARRALHAALEWPSWSEYPEASSAEETLALAIGFYLRDAEPGRRGLDFQGRLAWEAAYGVCPSPSGGADFITRLVEAAGRTPGATVGDAVIALKDRVLGSAQLSDWERAPLEALLGTRLDSTELGELERGLRGVCGVLVASPEFLLSGLSGVDPESTSALEDSAATYAASCAELNHRLLAIGSKPNIDCAAP